LVHAADAVDHAARMKETMAMINPNASQVRYAVGLGSRRVHAR
jgi:hypothetical protein